MKWEKRNIVVPAGVTMTLVATGVGRTHPSPLRFRAKREVNDKGRPLSKVWLFPWLSKEHSVPQSEVTVE